MYFAAIFTLYKQAYNYSYFTERGPGYLPPHTHILTGRFLYHWFYKIPTVSCVRYTSRLLLSTTVTAKCNSFVYKLSSAKYCFLLKNKHQYADFYRSFARTVWRTFPSGSLWIYEHYLQNDSITLVKSHNLLRNRWLRTSRLLSRYINSLITKCGKRGSALSKIKQS